MTAPDPVVAVIAAVLESHRWMAFDMSWDVCTGCDWRGKSRNAHAQHAAEVVAAAVREAGLAAPEPVKATTHFCGRGCDCSCCYGYTENDCHCFGYPCNCGGGPAEHGRAVVAEGEQ